MGKGTKGSEVGHLSSSRVSSKKWGEFHLITVLVPVTVTVKAVMLKFKLLSCSLFQINQRVPWSYCWKHYVFDKLLKKMIHIDLIILLSLVKLFLLHLELYD
jgi:hypothetical protein